MRRALYNPGKLISGVFGGGGGSYTPAQNKAVWDQAVLMGRNGGRLPTPQTTVGASDPEQGVPRKSLLSGPELAVTFGDTETKKKTLLGG